jgi:glycerol-3-phosphate O-acyltransferase/dihydroxyacetone phosphate acyltransferase
VSDTDYTCSALTVDGVGLVDISEALAASTVKIAGRDVLATWKVLFSVGATPVLYTIYAILGTVIAHQYGVCSETLHWMPLYIFTALPFFAMSALKFGEAGMDVFK